MNDADPHLIEAWSSRPPDGGPMTGKWFFRFHSATGDGYWHGPHDTDLEALAAHGGGSRGYTVRIGGCDGTGVGHQCLVDGCTAAGSRIRRVKVTWDNGGVSPVIPLTLCPGHDALLADGQIDNISIANPEVDLP